MIPDKKGRALATVQKFSYTIPDKTKTISKETKIRLLKDKHEEKTALPRGVKKRTHGTSETSPKVHSTMGCKTTSSSRTLFKITQHPHHRKF